MDKTLVEHFGFTTRDGKIIITQQLTDIDVAIKIILDVVDNDTTEEEYKTLNKTIGIMQKVEKKRKFKNDIPNIIKGNIEWFWRNDPMLEYETDMEKLWNGFKVWCMQNCKENFKDIEEAVIEAEVDRSYISWLAEKTVASLL